jgi:plasmid maintenance system antidote protein VapI
MEVKRSTISRQIQGQSSCPKDVALRIAQAVRGGGRPAQESKA